MNRILCLLVTALGLSALALADGSIQGDCMKGGIRVVSNGVNSTTRVMQSYVNLTGTTPTSGCTVSVYDAGTPNLATIYSDNLQTALANPFVADSSAHWQFYAHNGTYDVTLSGAGIASPFTRGGISTIDPQIIGGVAYADTFAGADACLKIQAAIAALPESSGMVDARGLDGALACSENPYGNTNKAVTLLIGAATYITDAPWVVPQKSRLIGIGRGDAGALNSTIQASDTFPSGTGVVQLCGAMASPCFGVQVEHLTIDCNGVPGCVGGYNAYSQEESWFKHLLVVNNPGSGIFIDGSPNGVPTYAQQNSGPYEDIEVNSSAAAVANTMCVRVTLAVLVRPLNSITCNADGYTTRPTNAILVDGASPLEISNIHVEHYSNGIVLGTAALGVSDILVHQISVGPDTPNAVIINPPSGGVSQLVTVTGVLNSTAASNVLVDNVNGITLTSSGGPGVGLYSIGNGAGGSQTVISSRNDIPSQLYGPSFKVLKNFIMPGTLNSDSSIEMNNLGTFKVKWHDSLVSGEAGPVIRTGNASNGRPCLIVQSTGAGVPEGATGGGACINGNGPSDSTGWAGFGAGYTSDMGTTIARSANPAGMFIQDGVFDFFSGSGNTPGSPASTTTKLRIQQNGIMTFVSPILFSSLGAPANGSTAYCSDCTNASNPCVGSGTGAFAKRLNGAWDCR